MHIVTVLCLCSLPLFNYLGDMFFFLSLAVFKVKQRELMLQCTMLLNISKPGPKNLCHLRVVKSVQFLVNYPDLIHGPIAVATKSKT
jgi:hypothetical protein